MDTVKPIWTDYDAEADILYIRLYSDVQDARTQEADHGVLIDRDATTEEVVGVEILDFLGHFVVLPNLSWLSDLGLSPEVLSFLRQKGQDLQQDAVA